MRPWQHLPLPSWRMLLRLPCNEKAQVETTFGGNGSAKPAFSAELSLQLIYQPNAFSKNNTSLF